MKPELKKAFKSTIERWEKIVEDVTYYARSECDLCSYFNTLKRGHEYACTCGCLIYDKTGGVLCKNTPHADFINLGGGTEENALRVLVFLKDLYIELIDCPCPKRTQPITLAEMEMAFPSQFEKRAKQKVEEWGEWKEAGGLANWNFFASAMEGAVYFYDSNDASVTFRAWIERVDTENTHYQVKHKDGHVHIRFKKE